MAEAWYLVSLSYNTGFWKSYAVISFKIFNALCGEKKWKNWKSNFCYWLNNAALMNLRRWTQCSSHSKRKLSNKELMQKHEEFRLATCDPETDCYIQESLVSGWIQTFYSEAIIKVKEAWMRFKNISPSKALFKNEVNNKDTPAPLYINPSFTDWVQNVPRCGIFLNTSCLYRVTILPIYQFTNNVSGRQWWSIGDQTL